ncbi:DUF1801 domain-containing protein [Porifericola rhodea]|uniref:DUF1801 domain-containing protein n=1 Tax=Porifericola rhodea TaxID=930972 RepID=UPI0026658444|nr:DUF1801 domain-containing protein [Porifericola rhodea]WKN33761.1 DUF1801 domain-containing protein [Porifericola rhodea]
MDAVESFIEESSGEQKRIMQYLHHKLMDNPGVSSKINYKIPFYYRKSWICYLNPLKPEGVELAFTRGNELSNLQGLLEDRGRKQIRGIVIKSRQDLAEEKIQEIIQEALLLDEEVPYRSKRSKTAN